MSELQIHRPTGLSVSNSRAVGRIHADASLAMAVTEAQAELASAKVDAIVSVACRAQQGAALLSRVEQTLAQAVPHASGRLATIADIAAVALAETVANSARRIAR